MRAENRPILGALVLSVALHAAAAVVLVAPPSHVSKEQEGALEVTLIRAESQAVTRTSTHGGSRRSSRRAAGRLARVSARSSINTSSPANSWLIKRPLLHPSGAQSQEIGAQGISAPPAGVLPTSSSFGLFAANSEELSAKSFATGGRRHKAAPARLSSSPVLSQAEGAASETVKWHGEPRLAKPKQTAAPAAPDAFPTRPSAGSTGYDLKPLCISCPTPVYPVRARREGWQGVVEVGLRMADDGSVRAAELRRSSGHAALDLAALDVAYRSRFALPPEGGWKAGRMKYRFVLNHSGKHERGGR